MLDQSRVRSGFDAEILLGERQFSGLLLALVDAGTIPTQLQVGGATLGLLGPPVIDRTYEPHPDAPFGSVSESRHPFEVEILFGHATGADLRVHAVIEFEGLGLEADLFVALSLATTPDEQGMLAGAVLHLDVRDVSGPAIDLAVNVKHIPKEDILATLKEKVDRDVDLGGVGAFKRIQSLAIAKLDAVDEHPRAWGIYVNLRLQEGPEPLSLKPDRGSVGAALNFLPNGSDAAMASRPGLYRDMAKDAFERLAEIDARGRVSHPWHKSLRNPASEVIGKIKGVSVGPLRVPGSDEPLPTLKIDVHVEYEIDNFFDPDAHLVLLLTPKADANGVLAWHIDADFHASVVLEVIGFLVLAAIFTGVGGLVGLSLGAAIAGGLIAGSLVDKLGHFIVDEVYSGRVERKADAALPDVVSGRVEVAQRRWDPFYTTHHDIALRPDGALVNDQGVALWGRAVLDRRTVPVAHVVIRDKRPAPPRPATHLHYRVFDAPDFEADLSGIAPGTDRRSFARPSDGFEPNLFELDLDQIDGRLAEGRLVPDVALIAKYVDLRQHQVHSILTTSLREFNEQRGGLIFAFESEQRPLIEAEHGDRLRDEVIAELEDEGAEPVEEEIHARVQARIDALLAEAVAVHVESTQFKRRLEAALRPLLRLDMPPENFAALQKRGGNGAGILHLLDLEVITMRSGLRYYREHPDFFKPDNLMSLPRYRATPQGPAFPDT